MAREEQGVRGYGRIGGPPMYRRKRRERGERHDVSQGNAPFVASLTLTLPNLSLSGLRLALFLSLCLTRVFLAQLSLCPLSLSLSLSFSVSLSLFSEFTRNEINGRESRSRARRLRRCKGGRSKREGKTETPPQPPGGDDEDATQSASSVRPHGNEYICVELAGEPDERKNEGAR